MGTWKNVTFGLSKTAGDQLKDLTERLEFSQETDAYKFCFAYALTRKLNFRNDINTQSRTTKWAIGNFDQSGDIANLLSAIYPNEEYLDDKLISIAEAGIEAVYKLVHDEYLYTPGEVLEKTKPEINQWLD